MALGAQSVVGLKLNSSTTYMTGVLTVAVHGLVAQGARHGRGSALTALRQLGALMVGAVVAAVLLGTARWAALAVPTALVAAAVVLSAEPSDARKPPRAHPRQGGGTCERADDA